MVMQRKTPEKEYNQQERQTLLTGIPLSPYSTRFGSSKTGWNRDEIAKAWEQLKDELLPLWDSELWVERRRQEQASYLQQRDWYKSRGIDPSCAVPPKTEPFAERILSGDE